ncbi:12660_t:CDS:2, partial [Cetraspora pellucida]
MSSTTSDESNENEPFNKQQIFPAILIIGEVVCVGKSIADNMMLDRHDGSPLT